MNDQVYKYRVLVTQRFAAYTVLTFTFPTRAAAQAFLSAVVLAEETIRVSFEEVPQ